MQPTIILQYGTIRKPMTQKGSIRRILKAGIPMHLFPSQLAQGTYLVHSSPIIVVIFCRNCIGQHFAMHEMRSVLAVCLKNFEFHVDENKIPEMSPELVLRAKNGLWLKVSPV